MTTEKNFIETVLEAQQKLVDNVVETTKKATNNNPMVSESIAKGQEMYKNWLEQQRKAFTGSTETAENATATAKDNFEKAGSFYQTWLNNQVEMAKKSWEMNQGFLKGNMPNADTFTNMNPMEQFNNWNKFFQQAQAANNWTNMMNKFNPNNLMDSFKGKSEDMTGYFNQYQELMKNSFGQLTDNLQNVGSKDAFSNMMNVTSGFTKFYEMWMPFWKSIQDKSFNAESFKKNFNFNAYQELMDNYFGFNSEETRKYMQQSTEMFNGYMKDAAGQGKNMYQQMNDAMKSMNPMAGTNVFDTISSNYTQMQDALSNAVSPFSKMATPTPFTKSASDWSTIFDKTAIYNIKNAEMQYMVYQQGQKVMDALVENIAGKMESGVEINNMTALYQEWLNIGDKVYVELFESDEYSAIMSEVSSMQLKLRKEYELQTEKMLGGLPIATKSELDELYKTIYDLKKEVRQLEKMMDVNVNEADVNNLMSKTPKAEATTTPKVETVSTKETPSTTAKKATVTKK